MLNRFRNIYQEFPRNFWILIGATFVDRLGGALLFPFFALYITERFEVGMTEVGYLLAGLIMDNYNPDWVWYAAGILALIAVFGLIGLHPYTQNRLEKQAETIPLEVNT